MLTNIGEFLKCVGIGDRMHKLNMRVAPALILLLAFSSWLAEVTNAGMGIQIVFFFICWLMLALLAVVNCLNFLWWAQWAVRMLFSNSRKRWVLNNWCNFGGAVPDARVEQFAADFSLGQLFLFYSIQAQTSRALATEVCQALFELQEKEKLAKDE